MAVLVHNILSKEERDDEVKDGSDNDEESKIRIEVLCEFPTDKYRVEKSMS